MSILYTLLRYPKLPQRTSVQLTAVDHVVQRLVAELELPPERLVHHWPAPRKRPARSDLPSPLKSPTCTSTQVTFGFHRAQRLLLKLEAVDCASHQVPSCLTRPIRSVLPSPLKSPVCTSTQVTLGFHCPQ